MSVSLNIAAYSGKDSDQFKKHLKSVQFCIENDLSFPKETMIFFEGKIRGEGLEDIERDYILEEIENGIEVPIKISRDKWGNEVKIKVKDIPSEVDEIIVTLS